jgi:hypothetical protein
MDGETIDANPYSGKYLKLFALKHQELMRLNIMDEEGRLTAHGRTVKEVEDLKKVVAKIRKTSVKKGSPRQVLPLPRRESPKILPKDPVKIPQTKIPQSKIIQVKALQVKVPIRRALPKLPPIQVSPLKIIPPPEELKHGSSLLRERDEINRKFLNDVQAKNYTEAIYSLDQCPDVNYVDETGKTALNYAVEDNSIRAVDYLLERGAGTHPYIDEALLYVINSFPDNEDLIELLLDYGADPEYEVFNKFGLDRVTPFLLLNRHIANVNKYDRFSPARLSYFEEIRRLLSSKIVL